jgi:ABC-type lipoprotein release transport system permease subunit
VTTRQLVVRALAYYWRSNLAVIAGVATAVAVLAGALLVGDSVRGSLRDLVLQRIGRTDGVVSSTGFFREALAAEMSRGADVASSYEAAAPLIVLQGTVTDPAGGRRVSHAAVYGVDDRFWAFHHVNRRGPADRDAYVSRALAADLALPPGAAILVRIERPSAIPIDSLHGRKEDPGRTIRLTAREVLDAAQMGDFSIQPQQGSVRAVFVPLARLQQDLDRAGRVNAVIVAASRAALRPVFDATLERAARPEDYGLTLRTIDAQHAVALESDSGLLDFARASAANGAASIAQLQATPVLTYLANSLRSGDREVPYSLVTAIDLSRIAPQVAASPDPSRPPIVINDWAARDLGAKPGDPLTLEYYVWQEPGYLETKRTEFRIAAIVPIAGAAADRDLAPVYPGITEAGTLGDWDPPFPIDLKRVRPKDEEYWKQYRTTPKAFIPYEAGQRIWGSRRYGDRTSVRIYPLAWQPLDEAARQFAGALMISLRPAAAGFTVTDVRGQGVAASQGSTDFGEYFLYFSFFLVVSALVLAALFFRLSVEQRAREVGLLRAVGYTTPRVRRLFTAEGLLLALAGSVAGAAGAIAYGALMMTGLRTWWSGAVGTRALTLHVSATSLAAGAVGAVLAAVLCIWWALRGLSRLSERDLLAGRVASGAFGARRRSAVAIVAAAVLTLAAAALIAGAATHAIGQAEAFFGAGTALLAAGLCGIAVLLRRAPRSIDGGGWSAVARIGLRNTTARPGRSVLAIAVIASAAFIVISVDAFRRGGVDARERRSGTGGFPLLVNLDLPLVHDPNSRDGRDALGVDAQNVMFVPFRLLPGEDASCLNLYQPVNPRILGAPRTFLESGRFSFQDSLAASDQDRANPWRLLEEAQNDATIPVVADANSMTYVLHKSLGDVIPLARGDRTIRLKLVGALSDSILQSELVMSERNFMALFPEQQGYRVLLAETDADADRVGAEIEKAAADFGADAVSTTARLAEFHAVENTYLSTFQTLGGLGLLVGTVGLAAVLLRNVLERRRELALLRAVGFRTAHLFAIVAAENAVLLGCGLALGAIAAAVAVGPAAAARGARLPLSAAGAGLLLAVLAAGLLSSFIATRAAVRAPLLASLRAE